MKFFVFLITVLSSLYEIHCLYKLNLDSRNGKVKWMLENKNKSISVPASVPGGVYTDLQNAGIITDILSGFNDVLTRWVAYDTWTYTCKFNVNEDNFKYAIAKLVLEGVDTVAFIELNGIPIGYTKNMFVRYVFDIKEHIKEGENELKFNFESPVEYAKARSKSHFTAPECVPDVYNGECHANQIRKMQASFSWDWGPAFPSVGIWRHATIEFFNDTVMRSITTHIRKKDDLWLLKVIAFLETSKRVRHVRGYLSIVLRVEGTKTIKIGKSVDTGTRDDGTAEVEIEATVSDNVIREWWPNGYGSQQLYNLMVYFSTSKNGEDRDLSYKYAKIGFRTLELVEQNASLILGNDTIGGQGLTFYFKVNGYPLFMKGSNWIPSNILPEIGDQDKTRIDNLLIAARDTHMSMLRVWGGGVYESDYFYRRCDELGILIWQDFLFACSMYPVDSEFLDNVREEIVHTVLRLQSHPSIAVWAGNNENEAALRGNWYQTQSQFDNYKKEYVKLYVDTIKPVVEGLDPGRRYLVSSPSNGKKSEEDGYVAENPYDPHYGDTHYYNYLADNWDLNIYPQTRFASEYGFQSFPSLKTMKTATNRTSDYSIDSDYSKHRQHSPNGNGYIETQMLRHLKLDKYDSNYFEKFVFYSQISQAMSMKAETEFYRQSQSDWYTMGALYWQLNDVWQAPSWSGIEYGGKWKMLHYFAKTFFAPVLVSPRLTLTSDVAVYLINDRLIPIYDANITVEMLNWSSFAPNKTEMFTAQVEPLSSKKQFTISLWDADSKDEMFFRFKLVADGFVSSPYNYLFPVPLKDTKGLRKPKIEIDVIPNTKHNRRKRGLLGTEFTININVDTIVLFLWLETDTISGHFADNGFIVTEPKIMTNYIAEEKIDADQLAKAISYQYYVN